MFITIKDSNDANVLVNTDNICTLSTSGVYTIIELSGGQRICTETSTQDVMNSITDKKVKR